MMPYAGSIASNTKKTRVARMEGKNGNRMYPPASRKELEKRACFYEKDTGAGRWKQEIPARYLILREFTKAGNIETD